MDCAFHGIMLRLPTAILNPLWIRDCHDFLWKLQWKNHETENDTLLSCFTSCTNEALSLHFSGLLTTVPLWMLPQSISWDILRSFLCLWEMSPSKFRVYIDLLPSSLTLYQAIASLTKSCMDPNLLHHFSGFKTTTGWEATTFWLVDTELLSG